MFVYSSSWTELPRSPRFRLYDGSVSTIGFYGQYHDLKNKKWTIQGPDISIELGPDVEEGEDAIWAKNTAKPRQWVNKQHSEAAQMLHVSLIPSVVHLFSSRSYSPSRAQLFWSLPHTQHGTRSTVNHSFISWQILYLIFLRQT